MNAQVRELLERFAGTRVLVIGEAMLDSYLEGSTGRLCREAPVPVVNLADRRDLPGGAANTAVNVAALGGRVSFLSVAGDDFEGKTLRSVLRERGVAARDVIVDRGRRTLAKHRVVADGQILVRYDQGSTSPIDEDVEARLIRRLDALFPSVDAVLISDYAYGVLTPAVVSALERLQDGHEKVIVADSRRLPVYRKLGCTAVKPNYEEACHLLGLPGRASDRRQEVAARGRKLLELTGARAVAVTLDSEGTVVLRRGRSPAFVEAPRFPHASVAGAGDTFSAAMTLALAGGADPETTAKVASSAASVVVAKDGTATCGVSELRQALSGTGKFVTDVDLLAAWVEGCRRDGRTIVFTNGCFDILHSGHVAYLHAAREQGEVLIVALNTDDSVRRLKGPERPINGLEDRARVIGALSCVDYVVPFDDDTPAALIRALRPDVFVKGGDYTEETLPEAPLVRDLGGRVAFMPFVDDRSTTQVIARIRKSTVAPRARRTTHGRRKPVEGRAPVALRPAR